MRVMPGGVVDGGVKIGLACPLCKERLIKPIGPANAQVLIASEFPGWEEVRSGVPMAGHAGQVLRRELSRVGLVFEECRVTNLWLHQKPEAGRGKDAKEAYQKEYEWHLARLLEEIALHPAILILGSDVTGAILKKPVMDVAGVPATSKSWTNLLPDTVKLAMAAPSPAIVYQRGQTSGEFSLAVDRFAQHLKEISNDSTTRRRKRS